MWQARWVEEQFQANGFACRIRVIRTTGDKLSTKALTKLAATKGVKGVFTKEIDDALLKSSIDIAVHSLKDVPTVLPRRLEIPVVPERGDARDALVGGELKELPEGAKIGTGSLRRSSQLRRLRPDLNIVDIRGNIDTRLKKLDDGQYDGLVLAAAGLERLGWEDRIGEVLEPNVLYPAVAQGALGLAIRKGDERLREIVAPLNHTESQVAVTAERSLLAALGGGCQVPIGGHAFIQGDRLKLASIVVSPDGRRSFCRVVEGNPNNPEALGEETAAKLLDMGAGEILKPNKPTRKSARARA
jgi:hydroxymethylbilane synthase